MKKLFLLFAGLLCAPAVFAASTTTKNTMKMVAYFPVPYVAYDTVSATQALDVGILNECRMSLGENQSNLGGIIVRYICMARRTARMMPGAAY